ncbi:MAG: hypothetical protein WAK16_08305 [Candidatus Cybelea sp.]
MVTRRKVPAALALGLLASLMAHGGLYGGEHSVGGSYHGLLLQAAFWGAVGLFGFFAWLGLHGARTAVTGSILAARLSERLPGYGLLLVAATTWYAAAECLEPHHAAASWFAVPLLLAAASWLVALVTRGALAVLAGAILAVFRTAFAANKPFWFARALRRRPARRVLWTRRRYARPPPIEFDYCA